MQTQSLKVSGAIPLTPAGVIYSGDVLFEYCYGRICAGYTLTYQLDCTNTVVQIAALNGFNLNGSVYEMT